MNNLRTFGIQAIATLKYVSPRIERASDMGVYNETFLDILEMSVKEDNLAMVEQRLQAERVYWDKLALVNETLFSDHKRHILLAYDHSLDIIDSIKRRYGV